MNRFLSLLPLVLLSTPLHAEKGLLSWPVRRDHDTKVGRAGQVVEYEVVDERRVRVAIDGSTLETSEFYVVPLDPDFTPAWIYVNVLDSKHERDCETVRRNYDLATSFDELFKTHPLSREVMEARCEIAYTHDFCETDGKSREAALSCVSDYLTRFPDRSEAERMQWRKLQLETQPYEYEGHTPTILASIQTYESYLEAENPGQGLADEIRLIVGRLYWMAWESSRDPEHQEPRYSEAEQEAFRSKALDLYAVLKSSSDSAIRAEATVAHYNLSHRRRIYISPNRW